MVIITLSVAYSTAAAEIEASRQKNKKPEGPPEWTMHKWHRTYLCPPMPCIDIPIPPLEKKGLGP